MNVLGWQCLAVADPPSVANPFVAEMPDGLTDVNAVAANGDAVDVAKDEVDAAKRRQSPNPLVSVLARTGPDARLDISGDVLPAGMVQRLGSTRFKVAGWWRRLAFAGNDEWVWLKAGNHVSVIHRESGRVVKHHQLRLEGWSIESLVASADGTRVAIGMADSPADDERKVNYRVVVVSALTTSHREELRWKADVSELTCLSFSGDRKTLLTGTRVGDVRVWDLETGEVIQQRMFKAHELRNAAMSPDGRVAVLGGWRGAFLWSHAENQLPLRLGMHRGHSVCFAPNGQVFATIDHNGARIWDTATCLLVAHLKTPGFDDYRGADFGIAFTPDSRKLAIPVSSRDLVELWDIESKQRIAAMPVHRPRGLAISRDGRWLAVSGDESFTTIFDLRTHQAVNRSREGHSHSVNSVRFAGENSVVTSSHGDARVWDVTTGQQQSTLPHVDKMTTVQGLASSMDGTQIVTSAFDNTIGVWNGVTGKKRFTLQGHGRKGGIRLVRFEPDGSKSVSWGDDGVLRWWNAADGTLSAAHPIDLPGYVGDEDRRPRFGYVMTQAFTPDAKSLFVAFEGVLFEFETATGRRVRQISIYKYTEPLAISPDGRWIASGENIRDANGDAISTRIVLRDRITLKVVREWLVRDPQDVEAAAAVKTGPESILREAKQDRKRSVWFVAQNDNGMVFSPDSKLLAWSRIGPRPAIDIVDVSSDRLFASIPLSSPCWCLEFSADGTRIASGHSDTTASIWSLAHPAFVVGPAAHDDR
jgi:WD40 repeat protein